MYFLHKCGRLTSAITTVADRAEMVHPKLLNPYSLRFYTWDQKEHKPKKSFFKQQ